MTSKNTPPGGRLWRVDQVDSATMPTTGERIRKARIEAGLSQAALARAAQVGERTVYRIETGQGGGARMIRRLEQHLGIIPGRPDEPDLSEVSALALVAEISRRLEAHERSKRLPLRNGPPTRVRFRTADGPGKSGATESPDRVQDDREQG